MDDKQWREFLYGTERMHREASRIKSAHFEDEAHELKRRCEQLKRENDELKIKLERKNDNRRRRGNNSGDRLK